MTTEGTETETEKHVLDTVLSCSASSLPQISRLNIISGTAGGRKFQKRKHIEPIEMERLWFDVTHLFEELLLAFD